MHKEICLSKTLFERSIDVLAVLTADGMAVVVTGGSRPHIGGVSIAGPDMDILTHSFPAHKDYIVSELYANALAMEFSCPVSVSCGIHYDELSKDGIESVMQVCMDMLAELISDVRDEAGQ